jgi:septal ring factor EnvC (AmiA/AmiB activator)
MLIYKDTDRITTLESASFRVDRVLQKIITEVSQIAIRLKRHTTSIHTMDKRLADIESRQEQILKKQAEQDDKLANITSQLNSIELLLQRLVNKAGATYSNKWSFPLMSLTRPKVLFVPVPLVWER